MKINAQHIIDETVAIFEKSGAAKFFRNNPNIVSRLDYESLHPRPLTATSIYINCNKFNNEIRNWGSAFEQWGKEHTHLSRFGAALVNQTGELIKNDPVNGSLAAWNNDHPNRPLIETDCCSPTPMMNMESLKELQVFNGYWCRSNVLRWDTNAKFMPHIDAVIPSLWVRLWAGMDPNIVIRFYNPITEELESVDFEPGRIYIIDTSIVHDAYATSDNVYQLFLSVLPSAIPVISSVILSRHD